jgi:hypothetical protein
VLFHLVEIGCNAGYSIFIAAFRACGGLVITSTSSSAFSKLAAALYSYNCASGLCLPLSTGRNLNDISVVGKGYV